MKHDHRRCEDEDDAARMAQTILRELGYVDVSRGELVRDAISSQALRNVAVNAERLAKWARAASKGP